MVAGILDMALKGREILLGGWGLGGGVIQVKEST